MFKNQSLSKYLLLSILVLALGLRTYKITSPILDWHSFRQADTASVTREFVKHGINILVPHYHDLSNIQSGFDNLEGYRMVEFPLVNALVAAIVQIFPFSITTTSRVTSVLFSLGSIAAFYYFLKNFYSEKTALLATLTMAIMPYWLFYSRAILPEPAMMFCILLSLETYTRWVKSNAVRWYIISLLSFAVSLLLKPYVVFFFPVYLAVAYSEQKFLFLKQPLFYFFPLLALLPFIWWRQWILQFPSGIPANQWLLNGDGIRLRPAWFRWLGYERMGKMFLGYSGTVFFALSFFPLQKKQLIHYSWWLGLVAYLVVFATGNVRHDYYQILLIPAVCLSVALGFEQTFSLLTKFQDFLKATFQNLNISFIPFPLIIVASLYIGMIMMSWFEIKGFYSINHPEYITAGTAVDQLLPENAKVIAPAFGDTQFLYQTNRTGWPIGFEIEDKISKGATHYVTTSYDDEAKTLENEYFIIEKNDQYLILDLTRKKETAE